MHAKIMISALALTLAGSAGGAAPAKDEPPPTPLTHGRIHRLNKNVGVNEGSKTHVAQVTVFTEQTGTAPAELELFIEVTDRDRIKHYGHIKPTLMTGGNTKGAKLVSWEFKAGVEELKQPEISAYLARMYMPAPKGQERKLLDETVSGFKTGDAMAAAAAASTNKLALTCAQSGPVVSKKKKK